jgi:putative two-component system response regulator
MLKHEINNLLSNPVYTQELISRAANVLSMPKIDNESPLTVGSQDYWLNQRSNELLAIQTEILERLGIADEFNDKDSYFHTPRVGQYAGCLAKSFGFNVDSVSEITITAPLHDIGKIGVPDSVLLKTGKLDTDEWEQIKQHTINGHNILKGSDSSLLKAAEVIALTHHERWDGQGYPYGLKTIEIHIYGRITAIADVYDALTMQRAYKTAWTHDQAVAHIVDGRGSQFDPELVDAFTRVEDKFCELASLLK